MYISNRLREIINLIDCDILVDIACDHGIVGVSALIENKAKFVIFTDISEECLNKSYKLASSFGLLNFSSFLCTDGIQGVKVDYDQVVVAGIGGHEVVSILDKFNFNKKAIISPHSKEHMVRSYINKKCFVDKDYYIEDKGRFYPIISIRKGESEYTLKELHLGKNITSQMVHNRMVNSLYNRLNKVCINNLNADRDFNDLFEIVKFEYKRIQEI